MSGCRSTAFASRVSLISLFVASIGGFATSACRTAKFEIAGNKQQGASAPGDDDANKTATGTNVGDGDATAKTLKITANDKTDELSVPYGSAVTIAWTSVGLSDCHIQPDGWDGASGQKTVDKITENKDYTMTCADGDKVITAKVSILVSPTLPPHGNITVNGTGGTQTLASGTSLDIAWTSRYADDCSVDPLGTHGATGSAKATLAKDTLVYKLSCTGVGGSSEDVAIVNVQAPPGLSADLKVNATDVPVLIPYGGDVTLTWTSAGADTCTITPGNYSGTSGTQAVQKLTAAAVYLLQCTGKGGSISDAVAINVDAAPVPTADLKINGSDGPLTVKPGTNLQIVWNSTNAATCALVPGNGSGTSGSLTVAATATAASFVLTCDGPGGHTTDTVNVLPELQAPTADITANGKKGSLTIDLGKTADIAWTSTGASKCSLDPGGNVAVSGTLTTAALQAPVTYKLHCENAGGSTESSVSVLVATKHVVTVSLTANDKTAAFSVPYNTPVTLAWASSYATTCEITGLGPVSISGTRAVAALTVSTTFTLKCTGSDGQAAASVAVTVIPPPKPTVTLLGNGASGTVVLEHDHDLVLTWTSTQATSCRFADLQTDGPVSGSRTLQNINGDQTFQIDCTGIGGTAHAEIKVKIAPVGTPATLIGINFEDLPPGHRDADFNDIVLCFKGQFRLDGTNVLSTAEQSVTVTTSKISGCRHKMRVEVHHDDGSAEPPIEFMSQDQPTLTLRFHYRSSLEVWMTPLDGCAEPNPLSMHDQTWAIVKANECRTTGI